MSIPYFPPLNHNPGGHRPPPATCEQTALGYGALGESLHEVAVWHPAPCWDPCVAKQKWKREERVKMLPVRGEETDRKNVWNQPEAQLF